MNRRNVTATHHPRRSAPKQNTRRTRGRVQRLSFRARLRAMKRYLHNLRHGLNETRDYVLLGSIGLQILLALHEIHEVFHRSSKLVVAIWIIVINSFA